MRLLCGNGCCCCGQVVYPALRDVLGDLTPDHLLAEHQGEATHSSSSNSEMQLSLVSLRYMRAAC
jgi:hypothetical protein